MTRIVFALVASILFSTIVQAAVDHVIVISMDGGKPLALAKSKMPNLETVVSQGASTFSAQTILPSKTLPSHVSMLTGVSPSVHKITWNSWNPFKGAVKVPTVFGLAKSKGYSTALFAAKLKFKHLKARNTLDKFSSTGGDAIGVAKRASKYLEENKPTLLFVHFPDADRAGHADGWDSDSQLKALENVDVAIGIMLDAIAKNLSDKSYAVIITADHGGSGNGHGSDSREDRTIPWITWGNIVNENYSISKEVSTMDTAATVLWLLDIPIPDSFEGTSVTEAYKN